MSTLSILSFCAVLTVVITLWRGRDRECTGVRNLKTSSTAMGRKAIETKRIEDNRNRRATFKKRRKGVVKKLYELSVLCDCKITLFIHSSTVNMPLYQYTSTNIDEIVDEYSNYSGLCEYETNKDVIKELLKKKNNNRQSLSNDKQGFSDEGERPGLSTTQAKKGSLSGPLPKQSSSMQNTSPAPGPSTFAVLNQLQSSIHSSHKQLLQSNAQGFGRISNSGRTALPGMQQNFGSGLVSGSKIGNPGNKNKREEMIRPPGRISQHLDNKKPPNTAAGRGKLTGERHQGGGVYARATNASNTDTVASLILPTTPRQQQHGLQSLGGAGNRQAPLPTPHWPATTARNVACFYRGGGIRGGAGRGCLGRVGHGGGEASNTASSRNYSLSSNTNSGNQRLPPTQHQRGPVLSVVPRFRNNSSPQGGTSLPANLNISPRNSRYPGRGGKNNKI